MSSWYVTYNFYTGGIVGWYWSNETVRVPFLAWQTSELMPALQKQIADKHQVSASGINIVFMTKTGD